MKPLFSDAPPPGDANCLPVTTPYLVPDSVTSQLSIGNDSLVVIAFNDGSNINSSNQIKRIEEELAGLPIGLLTFSGSERHLFWKRCIFFLQEPQDVVALDAKGRIRGQYSSADREDIDRLLTELAIILKRY